MGADPDGDRGLRHLAPTYISRDTRDLRPDGHRGLATIFCEETRHFKTEARQNLRQRLKQPGRQCWRDNEGLGYSPLIGPASRPVSVLWDRRQGCGFSFSVTWSADPAGWQSSSRCHACARATPRISWWSM